MGEMLHPEPRRPPPPRRRHPLDQRRHAAPVDHPGGRNHLLSQGRQRRQRPRHARPRRRVADLLLQQPAERPADVLPRPRLGITRLNVYAGEAAGYLVTDQVETGPDQRHQRHRRQPRRPGAAARPGHPADHPGQDLRGRDHHRRPGPDLELGIDAARAATPATCGCPTSTCPPRTPRTSAARTPSAAGSTAPGSGRRPPTSPTAPCRIPTSAINALGSRSSIPARPTRRWAWKPSWTRRWSTARSIPTWTWSPRPTASAS